MLRFEGVEDIVDYVVNSNEVMEFVVKIFFRINDYVDEDIEEIVDLEFCFESLEES